MRSKTNVNINDIIEEIHDVEIVDIIPENDEGTIEDAIVELVGTYNNDTKKLLGTMDEDYKLIDHRDFLATISDRFGEEFKGNYKLGSHSEYLYVYIYPDNMKQLIVDPRDDSEEWINMGVRLANSYDTTVALRVESIGIREVCANGMWAQTFVERGYQKHTQNASLSEFNNAITKIINADFNDILMTYQDAMTEEIPSIPVFLKSVYGKKDKALQKFIQEETIRMKNPTKWDVYNHATRGLTHGFREQKGEVMDESKYSEHTLERLHKKTNKVLTIDLNNIDWSKDVTLADWLE